VLTLLRDELRVKTWDIFTLTPEDVDVTKLSGSLTNAVFFISAPQWPNPPRKVLLRIYGPSSSILINRPKELYTLYKLSSIYRIGPRVFGTFGNGRIEEFFDSRALTEQDMRDPQTSRWIGRRMSELHSVDIGEVLMVDEQWEAKKGIAARQNFERWLPIARDVLQSLEKRRLPKDHPWYEVVQNVDIDRLEDEWKAYMVWVEKFEAEHGESERVFAHNDAQYGNLLRLTKPQTNRPSHHQIIVVDFEYAAPNPAAFDIANHFHEWMASYLSETAPWILNTDRYPTLEQRRNFYNAYISPLPTGPSSSGNLLMSSSHSSLSSSNYVSADHNSRVEEQLDKLEEEVKAWSPSSHAMWALWGIVQARDEVLGSGVAPEFNYFGYAVGRVALFRNEIAKLGVLL